MEQQKSAAARRFRAAASVLAIYAAIFGQPPDAAWLEQLKRAAAGLDSESGSALPAWPQARELAALRDIYQRIFIGPQPSPAPPWGSVYRAGQPILFQSGTLELRQLYAKYGLRLQAYPHQPEDSLDYELSFFSYLNGLAALAAEAAEATEAMPAEAAPAEAAPAEAAKAELERDLSYFLSQHLLPLCRGFSGGLGEEADFYGRAAHSLLAYLGQYKKILKEIEE